MRGIQALEASAMYTMYWRSKTLPSRQMSSHFDLDIYKGRESTSINTSPILIKEVIKLMVRQLNYVK